MTKVSCVSARLGQSDRIQGAKLHRTSIPFSGEWPTCFMLHRNRGKLGQCEPVVPLPSTFFASLDVSNIIGNELCILFMPLQCRIYIHVQCTVFCKLCLGLSSVLFLHQAARKRILNASKPTCELQKCSETIQTLAMIQCSLR